MSAKNLDKHNRWRNKTVAFRVSPEAVSYTHLIASVIICLFIGKAAYDIFKDAIDKMVDKSCDDETLEQMLSLINICRMMRVLVYHIRGGKGCQV